MTSCCSPNFTSAPRLASVLSFPLSHPFSRYPGLGFVQGVSRSLRYGSPREKGQHAQVENPEELVCFSSRMSPITVMSTWTDAISLDCWHGLGSGLGGCLCFWTGNDICSQNKFGSACTAMQGPVLSVVRPGTRLL